MAEANYTVYVHIAPNGKRYVGMTGTDPLTRWRGGAGYAHNRYFSDAIKKYGWSNIDHIILATGLTADEAERLEREKIKEYRSNDRRYGYNLTDGGEVGKTHSEESKRIMSEKLKGRPAHNKGKHFSEESRRKMSEAHKGIRRNVGVPFTEERKQKLRKPRPQIAGDKNPCWGKKWTDEAIAIRQEHRTYAVGGDAPTARPILQKDMNGNIVKRWGSISEASHFYCRTSIKDCLRGKYKQHRGFCWEYESGGK